MIILLLLTHTYGHIINTQLCVLWHKEVETPTTKKQDEGTKKWCRRKTEACHATDGSTKIAQPSLTLHGPCQVLYSTCTVSIDEALELEWLLAISPHILTIHPFRINVHALILFFKILVFLIFYWFCHYT